MAGCVGRFLGFRLVILEQAAHLADTRAHGGVAGDGPNHGAVTAQAPGKR